MTKQQEILQSWANIDATLNSGMSSIINKEDREMVFFAQEVMRRLAFYEHHYKELKDALARGDHQRVEEVLNMKFVHRKFE